MVYDDGTWEKLANDRSCLTDLIEFDEQKNCSEVLDRAVLTCVESSDRTC